MTLKVLDANDPENLLVDPPKPDWLLEQEAESVKDDKENKKKSRWGKKKKDEAKSADETSEGEASGKDVDAQDAASEEN